MAIGLPPKHGRGTLIRVRGVFRGRAGSVHHMSDVSPGSGRRQARQPVSNLPAVMTAIIGAIIAIHALGEFVLGETGNRQLLLRFAFIPIRELAPEMVGGVLPTGGERLWTFVTYAFLHANWPHALFNCVWMAAFGSPLAWRFGAARFLLFSAAGAAAGAALHLVLYPESSVALVGASAAISAHMAGAARFVFARGGPMWRPGGPLAYRQPAASLGAALGDRRVLTFLGIWFGLNLIFGLTSAGGAIASGAIAWEAHIGGFLLGLLLFPVFDPVGKAGT